MRALGASRTSVVPGGALAGRWTRNALWKTARAIPSLDLQFADNKLLVDGVTGQNLVTFTRASSGTYVGSDGLLKTATTNEPRFDHNPKTGESLGLMGEEARTNLFLQSEDLATTWTTTRASVSTNAIAAPNGTTTADKLVEDSTATNTHFVQQSVSVTSGLSYTLSVYVKAAERNFVQLVLNGQFAAVVSTIFDLSTGAVGATTGTPTTSATQLANGWWRFSITQTANATGSTLAQVRVSNSSLTATYTGDGISGIYLWGAQLEAGAFPTSYIPTTTATVTRAADVASITGSNFSSWYRQDEGTIYGEGFNAISPPGALLVLRGETTNDRHQINLINAATVTSGATQASFNFTFANQTKTVYGYATNNIAFDTDQTALAVDTSCTIPVNLTYATIGKFDFSAASSFGGTIKRLTYWPVRLGNNVLQQITQ